MKKQAAATQAKAEAEPRQMRAAAVAMRAEAQADVYAAAAIRKKAEALLEVAAVAGAAGQTSIFSRPADAGGALFLPFGLDAEEDEEEQEAEDLKHGNYLKVLSPSDTARSLSLETLPTGVSSTMTEADAEPEDEPEMPRRASADSEFAYATVIFSDDPRFPLEAAVMGALLKARTKMDMVCLHTEEVPEVWHEVLVSVGWKLQEVQHIDYSSQVYKNKEDSLESSQSSE